MIRINYIYPNPDESPDDIAIHNIKISDKFKNLQTFCQSTVAWLKNDPNRDYQDLELLLRHLDLDTHLIAKPKEDIDIEKFVLKLPNKIKDTNNYDYLLWTACKPKEDALKELLTYHSSYEENFECLKNTGCLTNTDIDFDISKISHTNSDNESEKKIITCELKYDFVQLSSIESLNLIIGELKDKHGQDPQKMVCGKFGESNVYALVIGGVIVSPIGWIEHDETNKESIEIIDFRNLKKI